MSDPARGLFEDAVAVLQRWEATSGTADRHRWQTLDLLADGPAAMTRAHRAGHVTASTLVLDSDGRVLLCLHGRIGMWMQLGGHCEAGDATLAAAALREATEESGIAGLRLLPDPIDVDVHPVPCGPGGSFHHDVRYAAICPPGAVERISAESAALGWFAPDALPEPLAGGTARLIAPAVERSRGPAGRRDHEG